MNRVSFEEALHRLVVMEAYGDKENPEDHPLDEKPLMRFNRATAIDLMFRAVGRVVESHLPDDVRKGGAWTQAWIHWDDFEESGKACLILRYKGYAGPGLLLTEEFDIYPLYQSAPIDKIIAWSEGYIEDALDRWKKVEPVLWVVQ